MKKIILLMAFSASFFNAMSQSYLWARQAGLYAYDYGEGIGTDAAGNVYVAGKYEQNSIFDSITVGCAGNHDIFVAKYNSSGDIQWVRTAGGPNGDYAHALAVDAAGNVYIAGEIEGLQANFGSTVVYGHGGGSGNDCVVAKYDTDGNFQWATTLGGNGNDKPKGIAIDASGNSYITGQFGDTAYFGSDMLIANGTYDDIFIAKLDPSGNPVWAKAAGSVWEDTGKGIVADASGNIYVTGYFSGTADFGGTTIYTAGYSDIFLGKWDTNGNMQWLKRAGGPWDDVAWAVTLDASGNSYITGEFNADAYFDALPAIYSSGWADVFVAKYDASGNAQWAKKMGGSLVDRARGIATDNSNVYITGQYGDVVTVNNTVTAVDSSDIFVASYTVGGADRWILTHGGESDTTETLGYEAGNAVSADANGYVYATGSFLRKETMGSFQLNGWSRTDIWIAKIIQGPLGISEVQTAGSRIHPNPSTGLITVDLSEMKGLKSDILITDELGRIVYQESNTEKIMNIDLSAVPKGIYFMSLSNDQQKMVQKIVLY